MATVYSSVAMLGKCRERERDIAVIFLLFCALENASLCVFESRQILMVRRLVVTIFKYSQIVYSSKFPDFSVIICLIFLK